MRALSRRRSEGFDSPRPRSWRDVKRPGAEGESVAMDADKLSTAIAVLGWVAVQRALGGAIDPEILDMIEACARATAKAAAKPAVAA